MAIERIRGVRGKAVPLRGDNIDTDRIIPARFLRSVSFEGLEEHLFADDRAHVDGQGARTHPLSDARFKGASILLVNANFGCGSSREHAPQAISRRGFRAVIGESFSEIFFGNSAALGMPCVSTSAAAVDALMREVEKNPATPFDIDLEKLTVRAADSIVELTLPAAQRDAFLNGSWDATGLLLDEYWQVSAVAARLPYTAWSRLA